MADQRCCRRDHLQVLSSLPAHSGQGLGASAATPHTNAAAQGGSTSVGLFLFPVNNSYARVYDSAMDANSDLCATCGAYFQCEHRDAGEAVPLPAHTESWADPLTDADYANILVEQSRDVDILDWLTGTHPV